MNQSPPLTPNYPRNLSLSCGWIDSLWVVGLLLAAALLYFANLGEIPLRDWDEGIVVLVARNISNAPDHSLTWLYPSIFGEPYLNKPPLLHWLIALAYKLGGVNEWTSRLPGSLLMVCSVPLLYGIGREIFPKRTPAVFGALVYLTLLPVVRHGRVAMLDGAITSFVILLVFCLLRSRRNLRWSLGVGFALGAICLTKGVAAGVGFGTLFLIFTAWDNPRLLKNRYAWLGILPGMTPVALWYAAQVHRYGEQFIQVCLFGQQFNRLWQAVETNGGPPWFYLPEIFKYAAPWLFLLPWGLFLAWKNRHTSWAKLMLVWFGGFLLIVSCMGTKLAWYIFPIYPALALIAGAQLASIWNSEELFDNQPLPNRRYRIFGTAMLWVFMLISWAVWARLNLYSCWLDSGCWLGSVTKIDLIILFTALAVGMSVATVLAIRGNLQALLGLACGGYALLLLLLVISHNNQNWTGAFGIRPDLQIILAMATITVMLGIVLTIRYEKRLIPLLLGGAYLSLLVFVSSDYWNWELTHQVQSYSVKPVAEMLEHYTPEYARILTFSKLNYQRPSLLFYSDRNVILASHQEALDYWKHSPQPYLLLDQQAFNTLALDSAQTLGRAEGWILVTHDKH